jgi:hypothetical protein
VVLYGIAETRKLIADALAGDFLRNHATYQYKGETVQ